ncbi:MAG TPA: molybdenum cofactor biosynthesis protein MoaE [Bryobacteraceae bacterium]|jgi:molybdopterin synthase catalytic subunit|nr:molybdenum cofactor biosynthesis protein MoaE [Bryobacteraceae bacterium]
MRIRVLFFGMLKEICGGAETLIDVPPGSTIESVFNDFAARFPRLREAAASVVTARNHEFAAPAEPLAEGDELAFLPPVSGGASGSTIVDPEGHLFAITREPLDPRALEQQILTGSDGAVVTFHGVVRNNTRGRATLRLEYECYEPMAIRKMAEIGREIASAFPIGRIAMAHRLGTLEVGEASVIVAVTAPHRKAAFDAALEGINRLKRLVPIWKKEFFADGEVWVEGEWDQSAPRVVPG